MEWKWKWKWWKLYTVTENPAYDEKAKQQDQKNLWVSKNSFKLTILQLTLIYDCFVHKTKQKQKQQLLFPLNYRLD